MLARFVAVFLSLITTAQAAGTLVPGDSGAKAPVIESHHVSVLVEDGFARTTVSQVFRNDNAQEIEAMYRCPMPPESALSELEITVGERSLLGEVVAAAKARAAYESERAAGNDAALGEKNGYATYDFSVANISPGDRVAVRYVYYEQLSIDTGVGRYSYPLEESGTDSAARGFWLNDQVEGDLSIDVEVRSSWPVEAVRAPGHQLQVDRIDEGHYRAHADLQGAELNQDFVLYYRLVDGLPGRVELKAYRPHPKAPGTFMMVFTPGDDLSRIESGSDHVFVVDTSGSMSAKLRSVTDGITRSLELLDPADRFEVITFSDSPKSITGGLIPATPASVNSAVALVNGITSAGGTNLYDALELALDGLDSDRATNVVVMTDAETNQGVVDPASFSKLMERYDVRVFGFLMGNSANWPLMRVIAEASGGVATPVSNADDILGQVELAKSKLGHEALHHVDIDITGVDVYDLTQTHIGKVYRGQQLVVFGRYRGAGTAAVRVDARYTGPDEVHQTSFDFPEVDGSTPELERLWAMERIGEFEVAMGRGEMSNSAGTNAIAELGTQYQLVTDYTSMVVLDDVAIARHGIGRDNLDRVAIESDAAASRAYQPPPVRVDNPKPAYRNKAPRLKGRGGGGGGGAIDPISGTIALTLGALSLAARRKRSNG